MECRRSRSTHKKKTTNDTYKKHKNIKPTTKPSVNQPKTNIQKLHCLAYVLAKGRI